MDATRFVLQEDSEEDSEDGKDLRQEEKVGEPEINYGNIPVENQYGIDLSKSGIRTKGVLANHSTQLKKFATFLGIPYDEDSYLPKDSYTDLQISAYLRMMREKPNSKVSLLFTAFVSCL